MYNEDHLSKVGKPNQTKLQGPTKYSKWVASVHYNLFSSSIGITGYQSKYQDRVAILYGKQVNLDLVIRNS